MKYSFYKFFLLIPFVYFCIFLIPLIVFAQNKSAFRLKEIIIEAESFVESPATGKSIINRKIINKVPAGNGDINELLKLLPDVQLSDKYHTSLRGGEITPADISISGGRTYQNDFKIDGISINNLLDPASNAFESVNDVPGSPQEFFLDSSIADQIIVYDSNIPAEYGGFTGGVVDMQTINPGLKFSGNFKYRTTRSEWTNFHIDDDEEYDFENSNNSSNQPKFEKHHLSIFLDIPINLEHGFIFSYNTLYSKIPLKQFEQTKNQTRYSQNIFIKYLYGISSNSDLSFSVNYAPFEGEYFIPNTKYSDYIIKSGGTSVGIDYNHASSFGNFNTKVSLSKSENSRKAPQHFRNWATTDTKDWGGIVDSDISSEGGFGNITKIQDSMGFKVSYEINHFSYGISKHRLKTGIDFERIHGDFSRDDDTYLYTSAKTTPDVSCGNSTYDCINNEQYFSRRTVLHAESSEAVINNMSIYVQDTIGIKRLTLMPGIRITHDDYMNNTNIAPRFALSFDIIGDRKTILSIGLNRYYGHSILTYKLREARVPYTTESRTVFGSNNAVTDWALSSDSGSSIFKFSNLDTPYSDEIMVGVDQKVLGGILSFKYVQRDNKNEFAKTYGPIQPDGLRYFHMTNSGSSYHNSYRISWDRSWKQQYFSINGTYQKTNTSNTDYDTILTNDPISERIWYDGKIIYREDLPRSDYNRPFIANLIYSVGLPFGFTFTNYTRFRLGYDSLENTYEFKNVPTGEERVDPVTGEPISESLYVYEEVKRDDSFIFDWKIMWEQNIWLEHQLVFIMEIENVFDNKVLAGSSSTAYERGRQFWLGGEYKF